MPTKKTSKSGTGWGFGIPATAAAVTISSFNANIDAEMTKPPPPVHASAPTAGAHAIDERLLSARLEAVEARTDTKFAQLMGKIETLIESVAGVKDDVRQLDGRMGAFDGKLQAVEEKAFSSKTIIITTLIGAFIGMAALVIGMLAYTVQIADFLKP